MRRLRSPGTGLDNTVPAHPKARRPSKNHPSFTTLRVIFVFLFFQTKTTTTTLPEAW